MAGNTGIKKGDKMFDRKSQYDRTFFDRTFVPVAPLARVPGVFRIVTRPGRFVIKP